MGPVYSLLDKGYCAEFNRFQHF